uniref:Peptidase M50 domain-containing protein n=1 Tax=Racemicystis crocea TaxID=1707966 RepID=A0A3S5GYN0_9BACT|nr:hypothetical protein [Racemicystis crocea]
MSFRLFGVNVEIQLFFWLTTVLLGWGYLSNMGALAVWVAVVFVSVLVHEFGHAFAVMRHRIEPEITLHGLGGATTWRPIFQLGRLDMIVISAAGPAAGFALGGLVYALTRFAPGLVYKLPPLGQVAIDQLLWVNIGWGIINLLPVMPFDGGHILEQALGPKRIRIAAGISFLVGMLIAGLSLYFFKSWWTAMLFGMGAVQSYQRFQAEAPAEPAARPARREQANETEMVPPELAALLRSARHALNEERFDRARALSQKVLEGDGGAVKVTAGAAREALEVLAWTHLLEGRAQAASDVIEQARRYGEPDAALVGAVLLARGELGKARRVLEEARARGDDRKEVAGPLIQVLLEQREVARAAAVAFDILDSLSSEDARKMAQIARENRAFDWAARLFEAVFEREHGAEDAYEAARALSLDGQHARALEWLRKAVDAGFSDRGRAWSDVALEALRSGPGFEAMLPRP